MRKRALQRLRENAAAIVLRQQRRALREGLRFRVVASTNARYIRGYFSTLDEANAKCESVFKEIDRPLPEDYFVRQVSRSHLDVFVEAYQADSDSWVMVADTKRPGTYSWQYAD